MLALLLCLSLLAGCGELPAPPAPAEPTPVPEASAEPTPKPESEPEIEGTPFTFTRENMPRMDGSTSLVPLAQAAAGVLLGESKENVASLTRFNRTSQSYTNLMWDSCDILIASWPAEYIFEELDAAEFAYEMEPIATDALIFVVNENNPVSNLTTEQIIGIYTGEITNWSEVGGADEPISAFQRNAGAGSQALMEKLVMGDIAMMEAPTEFMAGSMGELMEYVKSYDSSAGAIGYSVYYYANDMRMAEGLKIISVDGVEPTDENIRSGAYPHLSNYYTVIAADEPSDSPARVMFEWLLSAEGQRLVESEGYVPVMDLTDAPKKSATEGGFVVKTDWSALGESAVPQVKYTRLQEDWIDALAPSDDYGAIYPYVGLVNYDEWGSQRNLYGLFDENGRIICDSVYLSVDRCSYYDGGVERRVPMLMLGRTEGASTAYTLASLDGSFVSPESYFVVQVFDFGVLCARNSESGEFVIYDFDGNVLMTQDDLKLGALELNYSTDIYDGQNGYLLAWLSDGAGSESYLIDKNGNILCGGWYSADFLGENAIRAYLDGGGYSAGVVDFKGEWTVPHRYNMVTEFDGGYCAEKDGQSVIYDKLGNELARSNTRVETLSFGYVLEGVLYLSDGRTLPYGEGWGPASYMAPTPLICKWNDEGVELVNVLEDGKSLFVACGGDGYVDQLTMSFVMGPASSLEYLTVWGRNVDAPAKLVSWDLENVYEIPDAIRSMATFEAVLDRFSGEEYIAVHKEAASYTIKTLYTADMELYAEAGTWDSIWNGYLMKTDENFCTYRDKDGNVLFCYPLGSLGGD